MSARATVLLASMTIAMGCTNEVETCSIAPGGWSTTARVLSTSTLTGCDYGPSPDMHYETLDAMAAVGGPCLDGCTCTDVPATSPSCEASRRIDCGDGSGVQMNFRRVSEESVAGVVRVFADVQSCDFEVVLIWRRP